jgi:hypothetical protein
MQKTTHKIFKDFVISIPKWVYSGDASRNQAWTDTYNEAFNALKKLDELAVKLPEDVDIAF